MMTNQEKDCFFGMLEALEYLSALHPKKCLFAEVTRAREAIFKAQQLTPETWVEITKGQIDDCLKHSDNYDFAWAVEAICKQNNGY